MSTWVTTVSLYHSVFYLYVLGRFHGSLVFMVRCISRHVLRTCLHVSVSVYVSARRGVRMKRYRREDISQSIRKWFWNVFLWWNCVL